MLRNIQSEHLKNKVAHTGHVDALPSKEVPRNRDTDRKEADHGRNVTHTGVGIRDPFQVGNKVLVLTHLSDDVMPLTNAAINKSVHHRQAFLIPFRRLRRNGRGHEEIVPVLERVESGACQWK